MLAEPSIVVSSSPPSTFLLGELRSFHAELRSLIDRFVEPSSETERRRPSIDELTAGRKELLAALRRQVDKARRVGENSSSDAFKEAQVLMALLADQKMAAALGDDRALWEPLVTELDSPLRSGEDGLRYLLEYPGHERAPLAMVYLAALALGWSPSSHDEDFPDRDVEALRTGLNDLIRRARPAVAVSKVLCPDAYHRRQKAGPADTLPAISGWLWALLAGVLSVIVFSFPVWLQATASVRRLLEEVLALLP